MKNLILISFLFLSVLCNGQSMFYGHNQSVSPDTLVISNSTNSDLEDYYSGGIIILGQEISLTGNIVGLKISGLSKVGSPDYDVRAKIYDGSIIGDTPSPTATLLGSSTNVLDMSLFDSSVYEFDFSGVSTSGTVTIVFENENVTTHDNSNKFSIGANSSNPYADGSVVRSLNGANWAALSSHDLFMEIYYN